MKRYIRIFWLIMVLLVVGCTNSDSSLKESVASDEIKEKTDEVEKQSNQKLNEEQKEDTPKASIREEEQEVKETITLEEKIEAYMQQMTIEEKIGQLFMIAIRKDQQGEPITQMNEEVKKLLTTYPVGGIILFKENIVTTKQTQELISDLQAMSTIPLFIGVDEEGGSVSRVGSNSQINEVPFKIAFSIGETGDAKLAYKEATRMGKLLKSLGFNMDFAPVADIYNEPGNTVIGKRSFGETAETVTPMVIRFAEGLIQEGIQPVLKHFPGHGNTLEDSHEGLAYINKSLEELELEELIPFTKALESGVGALMRGHLMVKTVDDSLPASLSPIWGNYILAHYDCDNILLMTDAMDMGAIQNQYSVEEAALLCIEAENDICLMPADIGKAYTALVEGYKEGRLTEERINRSVRKILSKKVAQNSLVLE